MRNFLEKIAKQSPHPRARHATIVLRGGAVVAYGYNGREIHSEVRALNKLWPSKRRGTTIINIMLTRAGNIGCSKPCPACQEYLKANGIKKVFYTEANREEFTEWRLQ